MRRFFLVLIVASVACGTNSSNAGTPQPAPRPTSGGGYQDATPLSQTSMDTPMGAPITGGTAGSPTVATVGSQFSTTGTAPIVRNDVVRAREQALQAAFKSAVTAAATQIGKTANGDILNHARSYVARYKITREQNEPGTSYTVDIDAEVDTDKLKDAIADGGSDTGASMGSNPDAGAAPVQVKKGSVRTVLLTVTHVRRARDLKAVAELLRNDSRVREVRQQLYKQQRAILEVDIAGTGEDVALIIEPFQTEDGVTIVIDKRSENEVDSSLKLPI